jgi:hypothetical protein
MENSENIFLGSRHKDPGTRGKVKDILMIAGILAVLVIFFYKFVFFGMIPLNSDWLASEYHPWKAMGLQAGVEYFNNDTDPVLYMYPIKYITIQIMKSGSLPLWNPYILCGAPLWGNNFACPLNPLNIVFFIFSFAKAWGIFLMLQFAAAGIFMYFYSREIGANRFGSGVAALAYMLNITFVIWFQTMSYLGVFCWVPLVLLMIEKTLKNKSFILAFWCGVSFALYIWCGLIQLAAYAVAFSLAYLLFRAVQSALANRQNILKYILLIFTIAATAVLFMLPEILVQVTNILNSTRTAGRYGLSLLYPQMLVSFISPYFYGMKYDGWDLGVGTYIFNRGLIRLSPPYIGMLPLFLAAIGFFTRKKADRFFFLLSSAGIILTLMSFALPVVYKPIMKFIPFLGSVDHYRLTTIYAFSMAVMAGWGATAISGEGLKKKAMGRTTLVVFLLIVMVFLGLGILSNIDSKKIGSSLVSVERSASSMVFDRSHSLKSIYKFVEYLNMLKKENSSLLFSREAMVPIAFASISMVLIMCILSFGRKKFWQTAALIFLAFDLLYYGLAFPAYSKPENTFPETPSSEFLSKDGSLYRVLGYSERDKSPRGDLYPPNTGMLYGFYDVRGYENIGQARWYYRFIMGDKPDEIVVERFNDHDSRFLPFLNVKYLMSKSPISSDRWQLVYDKEIKIYKNEKVMPRVFVTGAVHLAKDTEEAWRILQDDAFDPLKEAVVSDSDISGYASGQKGITYPEIKKYGPSDILLDVGGKSSGTLVASDTYFPGWRAYVDGKERKVMKADYAFRGVEVKRGDRFVRFIFKPKGLYESLYLCGGIFMLMLGISFSWMFRMRCRGC